MTAIYIALSIFSLIFNCFFLLAVFDKFDMILLDISVYF